MEKTELINKVEKYLSDSKTSYEKNSIRYIGIRENHIISTEEPNDYYILGFDAVADKNNIYSTNSYFVFVDKISKSISYIIGPQSLEKIEE